MRKVGLLLLIFLIISTISMKGKHSEAEELFNDSQKILEVSQSLLQGNYSFHAKWLDEAAGYASLAAFKTYFTELNRKLDIQFNGIIDYVNSLPVLRGSSQLADGVQLQSMLVGSQDQLTSTWILLLTADSPTTAPQIVQAQQVLNDKLVEMGFNGSWNTMVQGTLANLGMESNAQTFIHRINDQLEGEEQEVYQDGQTVSVSAFSPEIHNTVRSGSHLVNVQMALHQNSVTQAWRFTIGSPLITIEY